MFGQRWRTRRAWGGALATALLVSLEPLVHARFGYASRLAVVWAIEVVLGMAFSLYVVAAARRASAGLSSS